jgi:hypothetical protein
VLNGTSHLAASVLIKRQPKKIVKELLLETCVPGCALGCGLIRNKTLSLVLIQAYALMRH